MLRRTIPTALGACLLLLAGTGTARAQVADRAAAVAAIDSIARETLAGGRVAGLSIGVVVAGDTLALRGYGYADLELDVPTPDRAIYEIGSVTKQFTAAAVLQLAAQGRIDLDADITKYLPDYNTQGHRIPVRRLLDHTSGIRGYTEMPEFFEIATRELPRDTLVHMFMNAPFDFAPGTALIYNNSGYFLLGLIIEAVSGQSYGDYVKEHLFARAGMQDSHYCSNTAVVKRRTRGYTGSPEGIQRSMPMDHTWPYAAGSLCSTAGDLIAWTQALHGGRVLAEAEYTALITPATLDDGTPLRYAAGLSRSSVGGHPAISHGGGIPGYLSDLTYLPEQNAVITVLMNTTGPPGPGAITNAIVTRLFGMRPPTPPVAYNGSLERFAGTYRGPARGTERTTRIVVQDDVLQLYNDNSSTAATARHIGDGVFRTGNTLLRFVEQDGRVMRLVVDQGAGVYVLARVTQN